jgi:hypothetical protein
MDSSDLYRACYDTFKTAFDERGYVIVDSNCDVSSGDPTLNMIVEGGRRTFTCQVAVRRFIDQPIEAGTSRVDVRMCEGRVVNPKTLEALPHQLFASNGSVSDDISRATDAIRTHTPNLKPTPNRYDQPRRQSALDRHFQVI